MGKKKKKSSKKQNGNILTFIFALLFIVFAALYLGEKFGSGKKVLKPVSEIKKEKGYYTLKNDRFGFSCMLPEKWTAEDISGNGDGFLIKSDDPEIDFRIYAQNNIPGFSVEEELTCSKPEDILFDDGGNGKFCKGKGYFEVMRERKNIVILFYVEGDNLWIEKNKKELIKAAKSLTNF